MESVFNRIHESEKIIENAIDHAKNLSDEVLTYDLEKCFDLIGEIQTALDSKDRAPKKKIKPLLKSITIELLNIQEAIEKLNASLCDNIEVETAFFTEETKETLEKIDQLFTDYKHYKKININEFLDQLDKLIY